MGDHPTMSTCTAQRSLQVSAKQPPCQSNRRCCFCHILVRWVGENWLAHGGSFEPLLETPPFRVCVTGTPDGLKGGCDLIKKQTNANQR